MRIKGIIEGLQIIAQYDDAYVAAEHDEFYAGSQKLTPEEKTKMEELGWDKTDWDGAWTFFV